MDTQGLETRIEKLYGSVKWGDCFGILHVAAIASPSNHVVALGPMAPQSEHDRFVLGFARARADVILTTGSILRAEPGLVHDYSADPAENTAFAEWRGRVLSRFDAPALVVLSASGNFPVDHPAIVAAPSGFVWSSGLGRERLRETALAMPVVTPGESESADVSIAIDHVRSRLAATTILVEAGPTTSADLYPPVGSDRLGVDELLLSHFEGVLDPEAKGPPFVVPAAIEARLGARRSSVRISEASGPWRFERWRSASGA